MGVPTVVILSGASTVRNVQHSQNAEIFGDEERKRAAAAAAKQQDLPKELAATQPGAATQPSTQPGNPLDAQIKAALPELPLVRAALNDPAVKNDSALKDKLPAAPASAITIP